jgi:hypothetical protein
MMANIGVVAKEKIPKGDLELHPFTKRVKLENPLSIFEVRRDGIDG